LGPVGVLVETFSVDLGECKEPGHRGASAWVPVSPPLGPTQPYDWDKKFSQTGKLTGERNGHKKRLAFEK